MKTILLIEDNDFIREANGGDTILKHCFFVMHDDERGNYHPTGSTLKV